MTADAEYGDSHEPSTEHAAAAADFTKRVRANQRRLR